MNLNRFKAILFIYFSCFLLQTALYAQSNVKITIKKKNITLQEALQQIEKQSTYLVAFNESKLEKTKRVDLDINAESLDKALSKVLSGTGFSYKIKDNYIMIVPQSKPVAEKKKVTGVVKDEKGETLIGVNVSVKGGSTRTITDIDGHFTLQTVKGEVIAFSYVGYVSKSVTVVDAETFTVILQEDAKALDEVVVTALGIKRSEKALSYNVQSVKGDDLTNIKDANFVNSLSGKVAGVVINSSAAGAGSAARVVMRGTKSLEKDDNALYVIDGIPMFNVSSGSNEGDMVKQPGTNSVADINPDDIESLSILTGPSAAALYGSDASNGVILITTKKGLSGKIKITYSNSTSFSKPLMMPKFQNTYGNNEGEAISWGNKLATPTSFDPVDFFNTGVNEINSITMTTGTEQNQTYASVSTTNSTGILPNNAYNRYNFSIRNTCKFLKDKMTLDAGAQYIIQNNKNMVGSGQYYNPLVSLYLFPRGENFQEVRMFKRFTESRNIMTQYWPTSIFGIDLDMQNPYWIMYRMQNTLEKRRYMYNASLKWETTKWMNITGRIRIDNSDFDNYNKFHAGTNPTFTESSTKGYYSHSKQNDRSVYGDVLVSINKNFVNDRLSFNTNVGASINDQREDAMYLKGGLKTLPNFFHYGNIDINTSKRNELKWHDQTQSVFASTELGWDHYLYLTLTGRNDWASQLAFTSKSSYFYPSVGLSLVVSELAKLPDPISYLKVRGSWAEVASAPTRYLTLMQYLYNEQTDTYEFPKDHYNTDLKPENTKSWEFGINAKLLKNHINFDLTIYRSNTFNQTFRVDASPSSGYKYNIVQTGNIRNQGVEFGLGYSDTFNKMKLSTNLTYTLNQNNIMSLANGAIKFETGENIKMDYYSKGVLGTAGGPTLRLYEGGTMGDLYINQRLRQSPNGYIWTNPANGNVELEYMDYRKIGSILPKYHLGWTGNLSFKGINLGFAFAGRFGGLVVSDTQATLDNYGVSQTSADAREAGGVKVGDYIVNAQNYYKTISSAPGTYYTYSATNVRLSELSLSYQLPKQWFNNRLDMTVGLTGKNLWMIYCKAPFDPESTSSVNSNFYQGVDYFQQPSLRGLGFNVKLSF